MSYLGNFNKTSPRVNNPNKKKPTKNKVKMFLQYCPKNIKHFCFMVEDHGWFCIRKDKIANTFVLASISRTNSSVEINKYINDFIETHDNRIMLGNWAIEHLKTKTNYFYHNKKENESNK